MDHLNAKISSHQKSGGIILLIIMLFLFNPFVSYSQSLKELRERKEKTKKQIEYINQLINETGENSKATMNKLSMLNQKIELQNNLIIDYNTQLSMLDKSISDNIVTIQSMTEDLQRLRTEYANMIKQAYRNKGSYSELVFLLSSENFNQAYKRMLYIKEMARYRQKQSSEIEAVKNILEQKTTDLSSRKAEQTDLLNQQMAETSKLNVEKERQSNYQRQLQRKEKELKRDLNKQQQLEERLQHEIDRLISQEVSKNKSVVETPEEKKLSNNFENNKGRLPWPVESGVITDRFGEHNHSVLKNFIVKNDGIDITTHQGAKARAIFGGTVTSVFVLPGGNLAVILRHGEYLSVYSNLKEVSVKKGDNISTKQELGTIFIDTFDDNKTVLKFQVRRETEKLDPEEWLAR